MRIALGLSYDGSNFNGWQTQPDGMSVQDELQRALTEFTKQPSTIWCAGRTDAGVHATAQVIHLDTTVNRAAQNWVRGLNSLLPKSIAVQWAINVPDTFNARFSAISRQYTYVLIEHSVRPAHLHNLIAWSHQRLDVLSMHHAAQTLVGTHDFSAFRSAQCQAASPIRAVHTISVERKGALILMQICANAFLHHMVRNIMGSLMQIGKGKWTSEKLVTVLNSRDRKQNARTFEPNGLYLTAVSYPPEFNLPTENNALPWWQLANGSDTYHATHAH